MFGGQRNRLLPKLAKRRQQSRRAVHDGTNSDKGSGVHYRQEISPTNSQRNNNTSRQTNLSEWGTSSASTTNNSTRTMQSDTTSTQSSIFQDSTPQDDLKELNNSITRIEQIIGKPVQQYKDKVKRITEEEKEREQLLSNKSKENGTYADQMNPLVLSKSSSNEGVVNTDTDDKVTHTSSEKKVSTILNEQSTDAPLLKQKHAEFVTFSPSDEAELIELIRRVAELVVQGERRAAAVDNMDTAAFHRPTVRKTKPSPALKNATKSSSRRGLSHIRRSSRNNSNNADMNHGSSFGVTKEDSSSTIGSKDNTTKEELMEEAELNKEKERQNHSALFDKFLERNVLSLLVNIATGVSFADIGHDKTLFKREKTMNKELKKEPNGQTFFLPPLSVATQAVQSVAILLQNVSQATSLYLLLSNNRINDLIGLPMDLYAIAVANAPNKLSKVQKHVNNDHRRISSNTAIKTTRTDTSAEMAELSTHFVSFLKSLVMRINHETLQFFIRYNSRETVRSSSFSEGKETKTSSTKDSLSLSTKPDEIEFPLFSRALDFCRTDQDSFVRLTAMNICLNTLRLGAVVVDRPRGFDSYDMETTNDQSTTTEIDAVKSQTEEKNLDSSYNKPTDQQGDNSDLLSSFRGDISPKSPDASIEFVNLPLRERIAISHHICQPSRVNQLVGHIFTKLTEIVMSLQTRFESLNDLVKDEVDLLGEEEFMEDNNNSSTTASSHDILDAAFDEVQNKRRKLSDSVVDIVADIQDELLMLDDIMKMNVLALNEQIVEMMFTNFIYPYLLDPLLRQDQTSEQGKVKKYSSMSNVNDIDIDIESLSLRDQRHPFIMKNDHFSSTTKSRGTSPDSLAPSSSSSSSSTITSHDENKQKGCDIVIATKTSFFGLYVLFHAMSNIQLKHLLLTALLHPFSPNDTSSTECASTSYSTSSSPLSSTVEEKRKNEDDLCTTHDRPLIQALASLLNESLEHKMNTSDSANKAESMDIIQSKSSNQRKRNPYRQILLSCVAGPRVESRSDEAVYVLHHLAGMLIDVALSSTEQIFFNVIAGSSISNTSNIRENLSEVIEGLCLGIMTSSVCVNGIWRLDYAKTTSNVLLSLLQSDGLVQSSLVMDVINTLQKQIGMASSFIQQIPSFLDTASMDFLRLGDDNNNSRAIEADLVSSTSSSAARTSKDNDRATTTARASSFSMSDSQLQDLVMDRLVRDSLSGVGEITGLVFGNASSSTTSNNSNSRVGIDTLFKISKGTAKAIHVRQKESGNEKGIGQIEQKEKRNEGRRDHNLAIATCQKSTLSSITSYACQASCCSASLQIKTKIFGVTMDSAVCSLTAYFKFDAMFQQLKELAQRQRTAVGAKAFHKQEIETRSIPSSVGSTTIVSKISDDLAEALYDEQQQESVAPSTVALRNSSTTTTTSATRPRPGAVVGLVGRVAFPCVCEVSKASEGLFTDQRACVVADGVKWQSLYLVFLARFMLLAEPVKEGSGGTGRIVTSCHLSCLSVVRDRTSVAKSASSARRLILKHESMAEEPPGVFSGRYSSSSMHESKRSLAAKDNHYPSPYGTTTLLSSAGGYINFEESEGLMKAPVLTRSRMDLWFENETASEIAYETFRNKISKARALRGNHVRSTFGALAKKEE